MWKEFIKNTSSVGYFGFVFDENWSGKSRDYHNAIPSEFLRAPFSKMKKRKRKAGVFKFLRFEESFRKTPFS